MEMQTIELHINPFGVIAVGTRQLTSTDPGQQGDTSLRFSFFFLNFRSRSCTKQRIDARCRRAPYWQWLSLRCAVTQQADGTCMCAVCGRSRITARVLSRNGMASLRCVWVYACVCVRTDSWHHYSCPYKSIRRTVKCIHFVENSRTWRLIFLVANVFFFVFLLSQQQ